MEDEKNVTLQSQKLSKIMFKREHTQPWEKKKWCHVNSQLWLWVVILSHNSEVHYILKKKIQNKRFFMQQIIKSSQDNKIYITEKKRHQLREIELKEWLLLVFTFFFPSFSSNALANHLTSHPTVLIRHFEFIVAGIHPRTSGCVVMFIERKGVNELSMF